MGKEQEVRKEIDAHMALFNKMRSQLLGEVVAMGCLMRSILDKGNKILIAGNGGSAADAQHFAAELVGRYLKERAPLAALALTTDTSILTAVGNDYGFDQVFSRQLQGLGRQGDLFLAISTSGKSQNLIHALKMAKVSGITSIALVGKTGGEMAELADHVVLVPSNDTPRIQEAQQWIWHTWCSLIDE